MRLSPSRAHLAVDCLWPFRPDVAEPPDVDPEVVAVGLACHEAMEAIANGVAPHFAALESAQHYGADPDEVRGLVLPAAHLAQEPGWAPEAGFAWRDGAQPVRLGSENHRTITTPGVVTMRLDALLVADGVVHVRDWKTGRQENTAPAKENAQLAIYALVAARSHGVAGARVELVYLTPDGPQIDGADLDVFDLDATEARLAAWVRDAPTATPRPGTHCARCPVASQCPEAQAALARIEAAQPAELVVTKDNAGALYQRAKLARKVLDALEAALREVARDGGFVTPDGKRVELRPQTRSKVSLDGPQMAEAIAVLSEFGLDSAVTTPAPETTWAAIEGVARAKGLKVAPTMREVRSRFAAAGATREWDEERWSESKASTDAA